MQVNDTEIAAWRYVSPEALDREIAEHPDHFTPWLKMEWERLRGEFAGRSRREWCCQCDPATRKAARGG